MSYRIEEGFIACSWLCCPVWTEGIFYRRHKTTWSRCTTCHCWPYQRGKYEKKIVTFGGGGGGGVGACLCGFKQTWLKISNWVSIAFNFFCCSYNVIFIPWLERSMNYISSLWQTPFVVASKMSWPVRFMNCRYGGRIFGI